MMFCVILVERVGLVHEECIAKMRLLSIVDLASNESGQIPYSLIKDTLQVNMIYSSNTHTISSLTKPRAEDLYPFFVKRIMVGALQIEDNEVEPWVVKAITSKLIDCKIDQMNQVIRVRCIETSLHF